MVPIPKGKNVSKISSSNYRAVTPSSILGKLFDRIVMTRYNDNLVTSDLQFGLMMLKETIE